jgi:hypothetical protein
MRLARYCRAAEVRLLAASVLREARDAWEGQEGRRAAGEGKLDIL